MVFVSRISDCRKYLYIDVSSELNYQSALQLTETAYKAATALGIRNYFFDMRGVRNTASISQNYQLIHEDIERIGFDKTSKIAILIDEFDDSHDFIGSAAKSAGLSYKLFTQEPSLLEWIQI